MDAQYSPQGRAERLLAAGRVVLATFSLLATWLDPFLPVKDEQITYVLLAGYVVYAPLLALLGWSSNALLVHLRPLTHTVDLTIFSLLVYFTKVSTSPFFVYFVFSLVSALLCWQWRGVVWTAVVVLVLLISMGVYVAEISYESAFELNRFIIHGVSLLVVAMLLAYLGVHEQWLQQAAAAEERSRLARDLHDGVLQSFAGAALQIETVCRLLDKDPQAAEEHLLDLQRQLAAEQRDLRFFIQELKPTTFSPPETDFHLVTRLEELGPQIERQWGLSVTMYPAAQLPVPVALSRDLYRIVHEALINVARHAHATTVHVKFDVDDTQIRLTVADNGRGFPFYGRYDLAVLTALNLGPAVLKERIASLGGAMVINSTETGARLDITLPLARPEA